MKEIWGNVCCFDEDFGFGMKIDLGVYFLMLCVEIEIKGLYWIKILVCLKLFCIVEFGFKFNSIFDFVVVRLIFLKYKIYILFLLKLYKKYRKFKLYKCYLLIFKKY